MTVNVLSEIVIKVPIERVSAYAADPEHAPNWYDNIKSVVWQPPKLLSKGSKITFIAHFLGRRLEYTYEIIEYLAGEKLVMHTSEGPFPMETTCTWQPVQINSTLMTLRNYGKPSGFSKIMAPILHFAMKRANQKDLAKLKKILECEDK